MAQPGTAHLRYQFRPSSISIKGGRQPWIGLTPSQSPPCRHLQRPIPSQFPVSPARAHSIAVPRVVASPGPLHRGPSCRRLHGLSCCPPAPSAARTHPIAVRLIILPLSPSAWHGFHLHLNSENPPSYASPSLDTPGPLGAFKPSSQRSRA